MEQTCAKGSKWRLHSDLLNQFACLVHCMTSEQIYLKFVPLLFKYISITVSVTLSVRLLVRTMMYSLL